MNSCPFAATALGRLAVVVLNEVLPRSDSDVAVTEVSPLYLEGQLLQKHRAARI